ncbi:MAG: hypothetical protein DRG83_05535, partial [Deltaproteobacteria bacterium]
MIITLSGTDGTGKTTVAKALADLLKIAGLKVLYRHEYDYVILKYAFRLIGSRRLDAIRKKVFR